ncbi:unnamed protein product [Trichogramma brassicae]|uniref:Reverse transcriptase RNase H-like domain-containing protein n=1 Tax=Trichogramma brassicae TaxID=86971 RepID=A0A6H5II38_9HYME|nr:unnamed protein product [Trichogramma brassicae]
MRQGETANDFYDYINVLLGGAETALKEEVGEGYTDDMLKALTSIALDMFIKGLPADICRSVDAIKPKDLEEALKEAVRIEQQYSIKQRLTTSTTEKECLAALYAMYQYRPYLLGRPFTLVADHEPLNWSQSKRSGQILMRWMFKFTGYQYHYGPEDWRENGSADQCLRERHNALYKLGEGKIPHQFLNPKLFKNIAIEIQQSNSDLPYPSPQIPTLRRNMRISTVDTITLQGKTLMKYRNS